MNEEWVTYYRKSNGRKAVPRQKALVSSMIAQQDGTVIAEFTDRDSTAYAKPGESRPKRDDFDRMMTLLSSSKGLRIGAYHADRLLRNNEDTAALIRVCSARGHLIVTHSGGAYDLSSANGRRRLRDDASAAEYEVDHGRERVLAARAEIAADGRWLGGRRPFGWRSDPNPVDETGQPLVDEDGKPKRGMLRLDETEATALRTACDQVLSGMTLGGIAREWNAKGLTGTHGAPWSSREIGRVLLRPRNAALMEYQGEITGRAQWPAIVPEETFTAVRAVLRNPERKTTTGPARVHLLSGLVTCACGSPMICSTRANSRGSHYVYRCRKGTRAQHVARDAVSLEEFVVRLVIARLSRADAVNLLKEDTSGELKKLRQEKTGIAAMMREENELRVEGLLTAREFAEGRREHMRRLKQVEDQIEHATQADILAPLILRFAQDIPEGYAGRVAIWEEYPLDVRRAVIETLFEEIRLLPGKGRPRGWRPGEPYFDVRTVEVLWRAGE